MARILIVSDSRGKLPKPILNPPPDSSIHFEVNNGATLPDAMSVVKEKLSNMTFTCAYMIAGICSITKKDNGYVYLPFETKEDIVGATTQLVTTTFQELDELFSTPALHKMVHFSKNKIGVVYFECCVIFDTL